MHLVDIGCGMKPIGILELPMQSLSEQRANGRLAAPRNTHEDDYGCKGRRTFLTHDPSSKTDPPRLILIAAIPRPRQAIGWPMKMPDRASPTHPGIIMSFACGNSAGPRAVMGSLLQLIEALFGRRAVSPVRTGPRV